MYLKKKQANYGVIAAWCTCPCVTCTALVSKIPRRTPTRFFFCLYKIRCEQNVYGCMDSCIYVHTGMDICTRIYICICMNIYILWIFKSIYTRTHTLTHIHSYSKNKLQEMYVSICVYMCVCIYIYLCEYIPICMYICICWYICWKTCEHTAVGKDDSKH